MFKSIEYKLIIYIIVLVISVAASTYLFITKEYIYAIFFVFVALFSLNRLRKHYLRFNQNILFLLNALDNGDYSFNFAESKLSRREIELNQMMNRIKEILTKARKEVIENEKFLSLIIESVSTGIVIVEDNHSVRISNNAAKELLALPIFTHLNQLQVIDKNLPELFKNITPNDYLTIKIANEREETQISVRTSKITIQNVVTKIIMLNNIGNELEAKEMESWIRLIRVMTHEIMNSVAPITSLTEILLLSHKSRTDINDISVQNTIEALETINTTARGLITFVESYRQFTGIPKPQPIEIEIIPLLENILRLSFANVSSNRIKAEIISDNDSYKANLDESQISQVFTNLIKNAIEAIPENETGEIRIKITQTDTKINIDFCNNGTLIPENVVPHIFVPFFTTKSSGSGIGLSISRYIVRLHGGNLKHHTKNGWTIFSITI